MTAGFFLLTLVVFLAALAALLISRHKITTEPRNEYRGPRQSRVRPWLARRLTHDLPAITGRIIQ